jgi:molecular chaperone DnaK
MPQIEVSFDIDANGIVNVSAKDVATGKEQAMTITGGTALGKDDIDRMVKEAESFAAEDHKRRENAEARNQADQLVYQVEKFLSDNGDKVAESDRSELTAATDTLKQALQDQDADAAKLNAASESVMTVFSRVGQAMYQTAQGEAGAAGEGAAGANEASSSDDDEVVEGEIVEEGGAS